MRQEQWNVLAVYQKLIGSSELLARGQSYLEEIISTMPQFCTISISLISESTSIDRQTANYISSLIKNLLVHNWDTNPIILAEKATIRHECIAGANKAMSDNINVQLNLAELISFFLLRDGVDVWKEPLNALIRNTLSETTLDFYCLIFSKVDYRINALVPTLLPCMLPIMHATGSRIARQKCLILYYLAILSFSFAENADDDLVRDCLDSTYAQYISIFLQILAVDQLAFFPHQIIVFKIFREFFEDFPQYSEQTFKESFMSLIAYLNKAISINYEYTLNPIGFSQEVSATMTAETTQIEEVMEKYLPDTFEGEGESMCQLLVYECLCFIDVIVFMDSAEQLIQFLLFPLLNVLANLLFVDKHVEQMLCSDPNHFVVYDRNPDDEVTSLRGKFMQTVNNILETESFKSTCLIGLLRIADSLFSSDKPVHQTLVQQPSEDELNEIAEIVDNFSVQALNQIVFYSSLSQDKELPDWKRKEMALFILGSFADHISSAQSDPSGLLLTNLLSQFQFGFTEISRNPVLFCRYLQCFSAFASAICHQNEYLLVTKQALLYVFLNDSSQATRIIALECLGRIMEEMTSISSSDGGGLLAGIDEGTISETLARSFINTIDASSKEILPQILLSLSVVLKKAANLQKCFMSVGMQTLQNLVNFFGGEAEIQPKVIELIAVIAKTADNYVAISNVFSPLIQQCFTVLSNYFTSHSDLSKIKQNDINTIQNSVSIWRILVLNKQQGDVQIFPDCVSTLLRLLYSNEDITLQQEAILCLKAIVAFQPAVLANNKEDVKQLYSKLLDSIDSQPEAFSQYLPQLILISYHRSVIDIDREQTSKVLESLSKCESYSLSISLLIFISSLLDKNGADTLNYLISTKSESTGKSGLEVFFEKLQKNMYLVKSDSIKVALYTPLVKALLNYESIVSSCVFTESESGASFDFFCLMSKVLEREMSPDQFNTQETNDSDAEVESYILGDIDHLHNMHALTSTKQVLSEFFHAFYLKNPMVFQALIVQMDFDEKIVIETVLEPHLRQTTTAL